MIPTLYYECPPFPDQNPLLPSSIQAWEELLKPPRRGKTTLLPKQVNLELLS